MIVVSRERPCAASSLHECRPRRARDAELVALVELAAGVRAGDHVVGLLRHAAGDLAAAAPRSSPSPRRATASAAYRSARRSDRRAARRRRARLRRALRASARPRRAAARCPRDCAARRRSARCSRRAPGPTSLTSSSCASSASISASRLPKWRARSFAVASPTCRMPSAKMKRASVVSLLFSIAGDDVRRRSSPPCAPAPRASRRRADRGRPACARARRRRAGRRACRPGPRCPSRGGSRNAAAPACAAPGRRARRCSARSPRPSSRTHRRAALRALRRHHERLRILRGRLLEQHANDLRDHVAGAAHDRPCRRCARPCGGPRPRCAAWRWSTVTPPTNTGFKPRDRRDRAGAADLHVDAEELGGHLLRRELVRDREARRARDEAELALQRRGRRPCRRRRRCRNGSFARRAPTLS